MDGNSPNDENQTVIQKKNGLNMKRKYRVLVAVLVGSLLIAAAIAGAGCIISTNDDPIYGEYAYECADGFVVYDMTDREYYLYGTDYDGNVITKAGTLHKLRKTGTNWYEDEDRNVAFSLSDDKNTLSIYINGNLDGTATRMVNHKVPVPQSVVKDAGEDEPIVGTWFHDYGPDKDVSEVYLTINGDHTASYVTTYPNGKITKEKDNNWKKTGDDTYQISGNTNTYGGSDRTFTVTPDGTTLKVQWGPTDFYSIEFTRYTSQVPATTIRSSSM